MSEWGFGRLKLPEEVLEAEAFELDDGSCRSEPPVDISARTRMGGGRGVFGADAAVLMCLLGDDSSAECARLTATDEGEGVPCDGVMCDAAAEYDRRGAISESSATHRCGFSGDGFSRFQWRCSEREF